MKIEAGKRYVTRDGETVGPIWATSNTDYSPNVYPFESDRDTYTADGHIFATRPGQPGDLAAEYVEPAPVIGPPNGRWPALPPNHCLALLDIAKEVERAKTMWPGNANSAHEQFAVMDEEIDELLDASGFILVQILHGRGRLWEHVKVNQKRRDLAAMRKEAIQVAAMALRFAAECCDETTGRK